MSGIAAGLGAFGEGLVRGIKVSSDLKDADKRRGLQDLQAKQAQMNIDQTTQMNDLSKQLAQEFSDYRDGKGAYAPAEGQTYNKIDPKVADIHYSRIEPLLQQQAVISGKNPTLVSKELRDLRRENFAENVFRASQLLEMGNPVGADVLKPLYNNLFPDGTTVGSTTYDKATDSFTIQTIRDGVASDTVVQRGKLVDMLNYGALNPADAVKMRMQREEKDKDRTFTAGETDKKINAEADQREKDRGLKKDLNKEDNQSAERRTKMTTDATRYAADKGVESRKNAGVNARDDKDYDDFQNQINDALGWNKSNPLTTPEQLQARNRDAAAMTNIWNTTRDVGGKKLSAYEVAQVVRGIENKTAKFAQKDGYTIVDVGGVRAILPK